MNISNLKNLLIVSLLFVNSLQSTLKEENLCQDNKIKLNEKISKFKEENITGYGSSGNIYKEGNVGWKYIIIDDDDQNTSESNLIEELSIMKDLEGNYSIINYSSSDCYYNYNRPIFQIVYKMILPEKDLSLEIFDSKNQIHKKLFWKFDILYKLASALKIMHSNNYLHRDLKPKSILMLNDYTPAISDLSEASLIDEVDNNITVGTYPYIAPELIDEEAEEEGTYNEKTDVYSLGGIFYSVITEQDVKKDIDNESINNSEESFEDEDLEEETNYYFQTQNPEYYGIFKSLIEDMIIGVAEERPDLDTVLTRILKLLPNVIDFVNTEVKSKKGRSDNFLNYLEGEKEVLDKEKDFKNEIISDFLNRKKIYMRFLNEKDNAGIELFNNEEFLAFSEKLII